MKEAGWLSTGSRCGGPQESRDLPSFRSERACGADGATRAAGHSCREGLRRRSVGATGFVVRSGYCRSGEKGNPDSRVEKRHTEHERATHRSDRHQTSPPGLSSPPAHPESQRERQHERRRNPQQCEPPGELNETGVAQPRPARIAHQSRDDRCGHEQHDEYARDDEQHGREPRIPPAPSGRTEGITHSRATSPSGIAEGHDEHSFISCRTRSEQDRSVRAERGRGGEGRCVDTQTRRSGRATRPTERMPTRSARPARARRCRAAAGGRSSSPGPGSSPASVRSSRAAARSRTAR